jgi:hypothetical protein
VYRLPPPAPGGPPPREFLYPVVDRERRRVTAIAAFQLAMFPLAVAALLSAFTTPAASFGGLVASAAFAFAWWRARRGGDGIVLRVEGDEVYLLAAGATKPWARFRLTDLSDVTLDTKTIHPMIEGSSPIPGLRFVNSQPLPEVDQKRIVLVAKSGEIPLTEAYLANVDVTEWFGKTRVFLRKHGWVPQSERDDV